jgi:hypothetical protein
MSIMRIAARAALCVALACAAATTPVQGADKWTEVRSANFRVVTNAGAREARKDPRAFAAPRLSRMVSTATELRIHNPR